MGKKKRYRLRAAKFGRKYGLKYGLRENTQTAPAQETLTENITTSEPVVMVTTEAPVETKSTEEETWWPLGEDIEAAPTLKKKATKRTTAKKETTKKAPTARKTTRKRTTKAKTTS